MRYNPKPYERQLKLYLARQSKRVEKQIDDTLSLIVRRTTMMSPSTDAGGDFFFKNNPALSNTVDRLLAVLSHDITGTIVSGIEWSWDLANIKNNNMVSRIVRSIGASRVPASAIERWNQKNLPALEAFEHRRINGMNLSQRVWNYTKDMKGDLELALDLGLGEGMSADRLSRSVRAYLREPDRLYRRVRDEKGVLRLSQSASNYHPGQGVYRSSYKNAKRLTTTETNMAYRSSDYERNQQLEFILGIEVHLSNNHTCLNSKGIPEPFTDICDELQGRYPKDFKFTGWHPNCRCYTTTILPDQDEFVQYLANMDENGNSSYELSGAVSDTPPQFKQWVSDNRERIERAEANGTLPYFLKDNPDAWNTSETPSVSPTETQTETPSESILARAKARHENRTPEQIADIKDRWNERAYSNQYADNVTRIAARYIDESEEGTIIGNTILDIQKTVGYADLRQKARNLALYIKDLKNPILNPLRLTPRGVDRPNPALLKKYSKASEVKDTVEKINDDLIARKWFRRGVGSLEIETNPNYNGSTTRTNGKIWLQKTRLEGVKSAFAKIGAAKSASITFEEADAMATYWHEITHNRTASLASVGGPASKTRRYMELANEFVARKSLPEFYRALGAGSVPHPEFMRVRTSTSYDRMVRNYQGVIDIMRLDEKKVYVSARKSLFEGDYSKQKEGLRKALLDGGLKLANGKKPTVTMLNDIMEACLTKRDEDAMRQYLEAKGFIL